MPSDPIATWATAIPDQILADLKRVMNAIKDSPEDLGIPPSVYIAILRTIKDPYARLKALYNAGCRGSDLR